MTEVYCKDSGLAKQWETRYAEMTVCINEPNSDECICFQHKDYEFKKCGGGEMVLTVRLMFIQQ